MLNSKLKQIESKAKAPMDIVTSFPSHLRNRAQKNYITKASFQLIQLTSMIGPLSNSIDLNFLLNE